MPSNHCLIIGGAGFIGSQTALRLIQEGCVVRILDSFDPQIHGRSLPQSATLKSIWNHAEIQVGDTRDPIAVDRALDGIDTVFHFAAGTGTGQSMYQIRQYSDVNVTGTAVLAERLIKLKDRINRVVISSSRAVYGEGAYECPQHGRVFPTNRTVVDLERGVFNPACPHCKGPIEVKASEESDPIQPTSIYGITKYAQEQVLLNICGAVGIPVVALRYQNVYGPGQSLKNPYTGILSIFSQLIQKNQRINVFEDGLATRDFVFIQDVVEYNIRAALKPLIGCHILNVGTGFRQTLLDVVNALSTAYGKNADYNVSGEFRVGDIRHAAASQHRLTQILGSYSFVDFQNGISKFAAWVLGEDTGAILGESYMQSLAEMKQSGLLKGSKN